MAEFFPRDLEFRSPTGTTSGPPIPAGYYGLRMGSNADSPREAVLVKTPDGFNRGGAVFTSEVGPSSQLVGGVVPWIEDAPTLADVRATLQFLRISGIATTRDFRRAGVFSRAIGASPAASATYPWFAGFQDCTSAYMMDVRPLSTADGDFRWRILRYDGGAETVLAETPILKQINGTLSKPMDMRLTVTGDTGSVLTLKGFVKGTEYLLPVTAGGGGGPTPAGPLWINIGSVKDYTPNNRISKNVLRGMRAWISETASGPKNLADDAAPKDLNADHFVQTLGVNQRMATVLFRDNAANPAETLPLPSYRSGTYFFDVDGDAGYAFETAFDASALDFVGNFTTPKGQVRRYSFSVSSPSLSGIHFAVTASPGSGAVPTWMAVYHEDDAGTIYDTEFDEAWAAERVDTFAVQRWMECQDTNTSTVATTADSPTDNFLYWTEAIPFGKIIEWHNRFGGTPWICVPTYYDSPSVTALAQRFRDEWDGHVYWEWSNESWQNGYYEYDPTGDPGVWAPGTVLEPGLLAWRTGNDAFPTGSGAAPAGSVEIGGGALDPDPTTAQFLAMGVLAEAALSNITTVFAGQLNRITRVGGTQWVSTYVTTKMVEGGLTSYDAIAVAPYVPGTPGGIDLKQPFADIFADMNAELPAAKANTQAQYDLVVGTLGKELLAYEMGIQHATLSTDSVALQTIDLQTIIDVCEDSRMSDFVKAFVADWYEVTNFAPIAWYNDSEFGALGNAGRFGFNRYLGEPLVDAQIHSALIDIYNQNETQGENLGAQGLAFEGGGIIDPSPFTGYVWKKPTAWKEILSVTVSGADYLAQGDLCGTFGDLPQQAGTGGSLRAWCALVSKLQVFDAATDELRWDDEWANRLDLLCGEKLDAILSTGALVDYSSGWSMDADGYNIQQSSPTSWELDPSTDEVFADQQGVGWAIYQRRADSTKSQHRSAAFRWTHPGSPGVTDVGLLQRVSVVASGGTGGPLYTGYVCRIETNPGVGSTVYVTSSNGGNPSAGTRLVASKAISEITAGTSTVLEFDVYDLQDSGGDGFVVMEVRLNAVLVDFDTLGDDVFDIGSSRILDTSPLRIESGPFEGLLFDGPSSVIRFDSWVQLALTNGGGTPIGEIPSLPYPLESDAVSGTLEVSASFSIQDDSIGGGVVHRMVSGRRRSGSFTTTDRRVLRFAAVVGEAERVALEQFYDTHGAEVPFNYNPSGWSENGSSEVWKFLLGTFRTERVDSTAVAPAYKVEFALVRLNA